MRQRLKKKGRYILDMKMLMTRFITLTVLALVGIALPVGLTSGAQTGKIVDHAIYGELLQKHVSMGKVNYAGFKSDEVQLDQYLKRLEKVESKELSSNEQFAFYANAYNAWTIKLILSRYPGVKSIKDLGGLFQSPWKKKIVKIDGRVLSLDDLEHNILRPRFGDPRVHFAINCAAKSCPPLHSEPFRGAILDQQLNDATRSFLNDPTSYRLEGDALYVSRIFKWFTEDFKDGVFGFYLKYATGDLKKELETRQDKISVKYLGYDWSLNGK
jgi:hypothetical protein